MVFHYKNETPMKIPGNRNCIFMHDFVLCGNNLEKGISQVFAFFCHVEAHCNKIQNLPFLLKERFIICVGSCANRRLRDLFKLCCLANKFFFILLPYTFFFIYYTQIWYVYLSFVAYKIILMSAEIAYGPLCSFK